MQDIVVKFLKKSVKCRFLTVREGWKPVTGISFKAVTSFTTFTTIRNIS